MLENTLLKLENIIIQPSARSSFKVAIDSLLINIGETVALVGESGSGKSLLANSILRIYGPQSRIQTSMDMQFAQQKITDFSSAAMDKLRNHDIAIMLQDPQQALNPLQNAYAQLAECIASHTVCTQQELYKQVCATAEQAALPLSLLTHYPHQLSGGQQQRLLLACAIANKPRLLILDEPTTALDLQLQKSLLDRINIIQQQQQMSVLLISHDLNLVKLYAHRAYIINQGNIIEQGDIANIFSTPKHALTKALLAATHLDLQRNTPDYEQPPVLEVKALSLAYKKNTAWWSKASYHAVLKNISFKLYSVENLGVIGESGSGKTSLAKALMRMIDYRGAVYLMGEKISDMPKHILQTRRKHMQMVFQDPFASLNPRHCVYDIICEGLNLHFPHLSDKERYQKVLDVLHDVELNANCLTMYPFMFSGGQRQRIAIARVLVLTPKIIILDEPTTALDSTIAKNILQLLLRLQAKYAMSYIFITHNCDIVEHFCDKVLVVDDGEIVESGTVTSVFNAAQHPKTQYLLQARLT